MAYSTGLQFIEEMNTCLSSRLRRDGFESSRLRRDIRTLFLVMKEYYVYIIHSQQKEIFYKGYTQYPEKRLFEHNNGLSRYTKGKGPWKLVYLEKFKTKREALIRERQLKKANPKYLRWLIQQDCNLLKK